MAVFKYSAVDQAGKKYDGEYEAKNRMEVVDFLHQKNLIVVHIDEKLKTGFSDIINLQIGSIPLNNRVVFSKQFSTMLSAGLPLVQALDILASQEKNVPFRKSLEKIVKEVEGGGKLSQAFSRQKGIFTEVEINLISAGEESGNLVEMMIKVADNLEKQKEFQAKIRGALIYPAIIFLAIIVVVIMLMIFMVPAISDLYEDFGGAENLPGVTKLLITISNFMVKFWWIVVAVFIGSIVGFRYYRSTPSGRDVTDRLLLTVPVFGDLITKMHLAEFSRLLGMLLKSGISIIDALTITANALTNIHFKRGVLNASVEVQKGTPLAVPIARAQEFPLIISRIIATGETTGNLDKVLGDIAKYYQNEVDQMTANLTKLLEPIILLVVGGVVLFIALVVYAPIYNLANYVT